MNHRLSTWVALWIPLAAGWLVPAHGQPNADLRPYSRQSVVCLDLNETCPFTLKDGNTRSIRLRSVQEFKDSVIGLTRRAEVRVEIDGRPLDIECAPYVMPTEVRGLRIQADTTSAWLDMPKRVQLSLWDATDPIVDTNRFRFPLRNYELFSHGTQAYNEPVHLGATDGDPAGNKFHHNYGLDMAGYEGREEVLSVAEGTIVKFWPSREDPCSVVIEDSRGLLWEHAHLKAYAPELALGSPIALGQKLGLLGRTGPSGDFSHLHVGTYLNRQDLELDRMNRRLNLYPWIVAAYQAQHPRGLLAVARPHLTALTGERITLDGGNSLSWGGSRIVDWRWILPDRRAVNHSKAQTTIDRPGTYVATLRVKDSQGAEDVDFCQIKVFSRANPQPHLPHLFVTHTPAQGVRPGQPVTFRLWLQGPGDGPIQVDFGDGTRCTNYLSSSELEHRFKTPGIHVVEAHATAAGLPLTARQKVIVMNANER